MHYPIVSIIMPIRNEADFIASSLGAVLAQDYPHDRLEVLVADGMSEDNTREIIESLATSTDIPVKIVDNPGLIVPTGFNAALQQARGEIIVRVDGHTFIVPDYVTSCVETLQRTRVDNVGGRMNAVGRGHFGAAVALATSSRFGVGGARFHYSDREESVDTVYMGAWPRSVFDRIGGFDEEFVRNQDDEFNYRLRAAGGKIILNPKIRSEYRNRSTFAGLARQYYLYGLYKVRVMQKHPYQMRPRQFAPPLLVASLWGGAILALFSRVARLVWVMVVVLYALLNFGASLYLAAKSGWHHLLRLPLVFATLHLGYGLGFLHGLIKFRSRWWSP